MTGQTKKYREIVRAKWPLAELVKNPNGTCEVKSSPNGFLMSPRLVSDEATAWREMAQMVLAY